MSLTAEEMAIVKSTVPILETGGVALTTYFYNLMFSEASTVRPFFNMSHQGSGHDQPKALAYSVLCVAKHIDQLGVLLASEDGKKLINTIVTKHIAVQVKPEHYPVVGKYLLRSIREVLGPEIATDAVISAWGKAYGVLADLLIGLEKDGCEALAKAEGGWDGQREFVIIAKQPANADGSAITYKIQSKDKKAVFEPKSGQYLTLRIKDDVAGIDTTRNYSLSDLPSTDDTGVRNIYTFTTQLVPNGLVSNFLNNKKNIGDSLFLHPITGEFTLRDSDNTQPIVLIAAGSGITPMISLAKSARATHPTRPITLLHISRTPSKQLLVANTAELRQKYNVNTVHYYTEKQSLSTPDHLAPNQVYLELLKSVVPENILPQNIYAVGPRQFMLNTHAALLTVLANNKNVVENKNSINFEFFGPHAFFDLNAVKPLDPIQNVDQEQQCNCPIKNGSWMYWGALAAAVGGAAYYLAPSKND